MNLALVYCWKEWRAQRGIVLAYTLLVFVGLCLALLMVPRHYWDEEGFGARAIAWFVACGAIGVVAFVAPGLVRSEFGAKDDQFVRRLPGALAPSFRGKLLFTGLATIALPLLGLCIGEGFVKATGHNWNDLFRWDWSGDVLFVWPWPLLGAAGALLLVPWVWAIGTWMPGGRMALGGTALFVLLVGVGVFAVLRQCPGLQLRLAWEGWLWAVVPLGVVVVATSWGLGRRGGGPLRSARFGLAVAAVGFVPPSLWLADEAWTYHRPDLQQLRHLSVLAIAPDGRHMLARGAANSQFETVNLRIDLQTGTAEQLTGTDTYLVSSDFLWRGENDQARYWLAYQRNGGTQRVYDLATGGWIPIQYDQRNDTPVLPPELRAEVVAAQRAQTQLSSPDGSRVWFEGSTLCREQADGTVSRQEYPKCLLRAAGHGFSTLGATERHFDFRGRVRLEKKERRHDSMAWIVRDTVLFMPARGERRWCQRPLSGEVRACEPLLGCSVIGLFDDDRLLCARWGNHKGVARRLFLYCPAEDRVNELAVPDGVGGNGIGVERCLRNGGSLLQQDAAGGVWLCTQDTRGEVYLRIDTATHEVSRALAHQRGDGSSYRLLGWPDAHSVLVNQDEKVLRIDTTTGERFVLFPRRQP